MYRIPEVFTENERMSEGAQIRLQVDDGFARSGIGKREIQMTVLAGDERRGLERELRSDRIGGLRQCRIGDEDGCLASNVSVEIRRHERSPNELRRAAGRQEIR